MKAWGWIPKKQNEFNGGAFSCNYGSSWRISEESIPKTPPETCYVNFFSDFSLVIFWKTCYLRSFYE
jgi:hypothetical protein